MELTSGRITALILGVPVAASLIGWSGYNIVAAISPGTYQVNSSIPVADGQLNAGIDASSVSLTQGGTGSSAKLTGTVQYTLYKPSVTENQSATGPVISFNCTAPPQGDC